MPAPAKLKTWQATYLNQFLSYPGTQLAMSQKVCRAIVTSLLGFGLQPCTCIGSSNSVASGMDASNRWAADTNLVWGTGSHSWIVLQQAGIAAKYQMCIDLNVATSVQMTVVMSQSAGFGVSNGGTDGSISARPTATDERVLITSGVAWMDGSHTVPVVLNVEQSTDGQCTRIWTMQGMVPTMFACFEKCANPVSGWTNPSIGGWKGGGGLATSAATYANFCTSAACVFKHSATLGSALLCCEGYINAPLGSLLTSPHDVTLEWPMSPVIVASTTSGVRGNLGTLQDFYFGSTSVGSGTGYDSGGSPNQWIQVGQMIMPWNGSAVQSG